MIQYYKKDKERGSGGEWILIERLDKILAGTGRWSRREAGELVRAGRVEVAGAVARRPEEKYEREGLDLRVDGEQVCGERYVYLMLHKPAGLVSATEDPRQPTVLELLPQHLRRVGLFPAGRLDKDTEGLLLITNDGALAHRLLSPVKHVPKTYLVHTKKPVTSQMCEKLEAGVEIGDETPTAPAKTKLLSDTDCGLLLTITEGRFHQVKRMLQAVGNEVVYLKRLSMGALVLDETLSKGSWRALTEEEKAQLGV